MKKRPSALLLLLPALLLLSVAPARAQQALAEASALSEAASRTAEERLPVLSPKAALRVRLLHPRLVRRASAPADVRSLSKGARSAPFALEVAETEGGNRSTWLVVGGIAALGAAAAAAVLLLGGGGGDGGGGNGGDGEVGIPLPPGRP